MDYFEFVEYQGIHYYVKNGILNLNNKGIKNLSEIKNLEKLSDLKELHLQSNSITHISSLDNLKNLCHKSFFFLVFKCFT